MDFDRTIVSNDNGWEYGEFGKEMGEFIERTPANLQESLGASMETHKTPKVPDWRIFVPNPDISG
jgi:hypothetical protein